MNIEELYRAFNLKPNKCYCVDIELEKFSLVHENIVDERNLYNITFEHIQSIEDIITEKGAFSNKGIPTVIYEKRHISRSGNPERDYPYLYHMFWCRRLRDIYGNRLDDFKYKFSGSYGSDGKFRVFSWHNDYDEEIQHHICKDCYAQLAEHYGGIQKFRKICGIRVRYDNITYHEAKKFSLEKFYQDINNGKLEGIKGITNVDSFRRFRRDPYYREQGWKEYAYKLKETKGFQCEECGEKFIDKNGKYIEKTLQVHHKDCNPLNTSLSNHVVLCVDCHKKKHNGKAYVDVD